MTTKKLKPLQEPKGLPSFLIAAQELPQVTGDGGPNWSCPHCRTILVKQAGEDLIAEYVFLCPKCGGYSATRHRH